MEPRTELAHSNGKAPQIGDFPFTEEMEAGLLALQEFKNKLQDFAVDNPAEALLGVVTGAAWVFYQAEKDSHDECNTYVDALHYISTCLSVGYSPVQPRTQTGRLVSAIVMSIGPSLSAWMLEGRLVARQQAEVPAPPAAAAPPDFSPVVDRLDAILQELKEQRAGGGGPPQAA